MTGSVWDEVVGQVEQVAALREALTADRVAHAWLFTGPPGVGKRHVAMTFAAALNCPNGGDGDCDVCRRVLRGVYPDVHVIEPEGDNLLVDDVRWLREEAYRSRHKGRAAVFVVDEADRMTEPAANALLKVLEEPPSDVVIVLIARGVETVVATIPSRARVLAFANLPASSLADALAQRLGVSQDRAAWAAAAGHGRFDRARALLVDEAAVARRSSTLALVERIGSGRGADALDAAGAVVTAADQASAALRSRHAEELAELEAVYGKSRGSGSIRKRLEVTHRRALRRARFDALREAVADLLSFYRDVVALRSGRGPSALVNRDQADRLTRAAESVNEAMALGAAAALEEADRRLVVGSSPTLVLEATFLSVQAALSGRPAPMPRTVLI